MRPRPPPATAAAAHSAALAFLSGGSPGGGGSIGRVHHVHRRRLLPLAITWLTTFLSSSARTGGEGNLTSTSSSSGSSSGSPSRGGTCLLGASAMSGGSGDMEAAIRRLVPPLSYDARKGQMGRIGVLGGSADFTGAPFYAGMASLKVGGDLSYILTAEEASGPIKTYSPELMVTPVYSAKELLQGAAPSFSAKGAKEKAVAAMVDKVTAFFPKLHVLVIGPGLGRDPWVMEATRRVIVEARRAGLPLVIDADGLWLVAHEPEVVKGFPAGCPVVLTPNLIEFARLQAGVTGGAVETAKPSGAAPQHGDVMELARKLGGKVTICLKGPEDIIADGERWLVVAEPGALRRSGGLGDILAGTMGVLVHWAQMALPITDVEGGVEATAAAHPEAAGKGQQQVTPGVEMDPQDRALWACAAASVVARRASRRAFVEKRRSMTAPDAIAHLGEVLEELAPTKVD